jgi:predicted nucleic acid-binding protein
MLEAFVDTSGWAAWAHAPEQFHALAVAAVEDLWNRGGRLVTTNWILVELTALLTSPMRVPKPQQIQLVQDIRGDPGVLVVTVDAATEAAAWNLWQTRPDKDWSMVDCASFVVMGQRQIVEAVTADHHFEQAGFVRLLK